MADKYDVNYDIEANVFKINDTIVDCNEPAYLEFIENTSAQTIQSLTVYEVDYDKVKTVKDVVRVLKAIKVMFYGEEYIKGIEDLVKEVKENGRS
jgi:hypothetical protein